MDLLIEEYQQKPELFVYSSMKHYSLDEIKKWERFYRAHFVNSLSGFKSVSLIGTMSSQGKFNLAVFSNIVHIGADPALIGFINRPREAAPHTLSNIEETGEYTINLIPASIISQAHQTSAKYPKDVSEFEETGLTPEIHACCRAPFVKESPVKYSLTLQQIIPITLNNTWLVIGALTNVFIDNQQWVGEDGFISLEQGNVTSSLGIDGYYQPRLLERFPYAKPRSGS